MKTKMKLFIWTGFCPDYTDGLAFAIARDETEARKLVEEDRGYRIWEWGDLEIKSVTRKIARSVSGGG